MQAYRMDDYEDGLGGDTFREATFRSPGAQESSFGRVARAREAAEVASIAWDWERPVSAGGVGLDGVPRMRRPRSATRLQTEVELSRTQAQINNLQAKVVAGSTEVERLQQKLEAAEADATLQRSLAATAKAELMKLRTRVPDSQQVWDERSERQIQQLQAKASFAESRMRDMQLELEKLSAQEADAQARAEQCCRDREELRHKMRMTVSEVDAATTRARELEMDISRWQAWAEEVAGDHQEVSSQLQSVQRRLTELNQLLAIERERASDLEGKVRAKDQELQQKGQAETQLEVQKGEYERQLSQLRSAALDLQSGRAQDLERELQTAYQKNAELQAMMERKQRDLDSQAAAHCEALSSALARALALEQQLDQRATETRALTQSSQTLEQELQAQRRQHEEQQAELQRQHARAKALEADAQARAEQCCRDREDLRHNVHMTVDRMRRTAELLELFSQADVSAATSEIDAATARARELEMAARARELEMDISRWQAWAEEVAGDHQEVSSQLQSVQRRLTELNQLLAIERQRTSDLEEKVRAKDQELQQKGQAETQLEVQKREYERQMSQLRSAVALELESTNTLAQDLERELQTAYRKNTELQAQLAQCEQQQRQHMTLEKRNAERAIDLEARLRNQEQEQEHRLNAALSDLQSAAQREAGLEQRAMQREQTLQLESTREQEAQRQRQMLSQQLQNAQRDTSQLQAMMERKQRDLDSQAAAHSEALNGALARALALEQQLDQRATETRALTKSALESRQSSQTLEQELQAQRRQHEEQQAELQRQHARAKGLEARVEGLQAHAAALSSSREELAQERARSSELAVLQQRLEAQVEQARKEGLAQVWALEDAAEAEMRLEAQLLAAERNAEATQSLCQELSCQMERLEVSSERERMAFAAESKRLQEQLSSSKEMAAEEACRAEKRAEKQMASMGCLEHQVATQRHVAQRNCAEASELALSLKDRMVELTQLKVKNEEAAQLARERAAELQKLKETAEQAEVAHAQCQRLHEELDEAKRQSQAQAQRQQDSALDACEQKFAEERAKASELALSLKDKMVETTQLKIKNEEAAQLARERAAELQKLQGTAEQAEVAHAQCQRLHEELHEAKRQLLAQAQRQQDSALDACEQKFAEERAKVSELALALMDRMVEMTELKAKNEEAAQLARESAAELQKLQETAEQVAHSQCQRLHEELDEAKRQALQAQAGPKLADSAKGKLPNSLEQSEVCEPVLGVSVPHLCTSFLQEAEEAGLPRTCSLQDMEPVVLKATKDQGAAYVQQLQGCSRGHATQLLSVPARTPVRAIADALKHHCQAAGLVEDQAFIWLGLLCANLHRESPKTAEQIRAQLVARMQRIGCVLALFSPWQKPSYLQRAWCVAEMEVALSLGKGGCELVMLTTPDEVDQLGEASCFGNGLAQAWRQLLEPCDLESSGTPALQQLCGNVTARLASLVRSWMATTAEAWLRRQLAAGAWDPRALAAACDAVGWLLREVSLHHRAAALLQDGLLLALAPQGSHLLCCLGMGACTGDQSELLQSCEDARRGHERMGTLETMAGVDLLSNIGAARWRSGDLEGAAGALQQALAIRRNTRTLESAEGAMLLRNLGVVRWAKGDYEKAIEAYGEARRVRECTGSLSGADGAVLLLNIGYAEANLGVAQRALEAFEEALSVMASASSGEGRYSSFALPEALELAPCGATLLSSIAVAKGNCGYHDDALSAYKRAREIRQRTRTMDSPAGAVLLRNTGVALAGRADSEGALDAFLQAKAIREQTGTLVTCGGANLMAKLAALRAERGEEALGDCRTARDLHERVGTLQTPGGRTVLQLLESLQRR